MYRYRQEGETCNIRTVHWRYVLREYRGLLLRRKECLSAYTLASTLTLTRTGRQLMALTANVSWKNAQQNDRSLVCMVLLVTRSQSSAISIVL